MVIFRSDDKMPVVRHHAVGKDGKRKSLVGFRKNFLKSKIVALFLEKLQAGDRTVQNMEHNSSGTIAGGPRHNKSCAERGSGAIK